ncbi:MAG TPA: hypothetical protein PKB07_01830 [Flavilitoribacter sp.]|nr:hypothetical protein [Flavilitoribacter sp.]
MEKKVNGPALQRRKCFFGFILCLAIAASSTGCVKEDDIVVDDIIIPQLNNTSQDSIANIVVDDFIIL